MILNTLPKQFRGFTITKQYRKIPNRNNNNGNNNTASGSVRYNHAPYQPSSRTKGTETLNMNNSLNAKINPTFLKPRGVYPTWETGCQNRPKHPTKKRIRLNAEPMCWSIY